jgi:hypothetical protein
VASSARSVIGYSFVDSGLGEQFFVFFGVAFAEFGVGGVSCPVYGAAVFEPFFFFVVAAYAFGFFLQVFVSFVRYFFDAPLSHVFPLAVFAIAPVATSFGVGGVLAGSWCVALEVEFGQEFLLSAGVAEFDADGEIGGGVGHSVSLWVGFPHSEI